MKNWLYFLGGVAACVTLLSCGGGKVLDNVELEAWREGKPQGRMNMKLVELKLENGKLGKHLTTEVKMSVGSRNRLHSINKMTMNSDFSLRAIDKVTNYEDKETKLKITVEGNKVTVVKEMDGGKPKVEEITVKDKVYGEIHHKIYAADLTRSGTEKIYHIFYEPIRQSVPLRVRCLERVSLEEGGETIPCIRYGVQSISKPGQFDDYYISEKGHRLIRANLGPITLKKSGS